MLDKEEKQETRLNAFLGSNYINMYYICGYIRGAFRNQLQIIYFQDCLEYYDVAFVIVT